MSSNLQCSVSCGEGVKERLVECRGETGESSACDPETKPAERANCNLGQCPHWKIGEWAEVRTHTLYKQWSSSSLETRYCILCYLYGEQITSSVDKNKLSFPLPTDTAPVFFFFRN